MDNLVNCSRCGSDACYVEEVNQDIKPTIVTDVVFKLILY